MTELPVADGSTTILAKPEPLGLEEHVTRTAVRQRKTGLASARPLSITVASKPGEPVIPGYRIVSRLGRGGMGIVYSAIHLALNRAVALKMLSGSAYDINPEVRDRFRKEAESLASLRHANIVPVYEVAEVDGVPFFTMELVEGGDLATHIRYRPPTPTSAARIAFQLAHGVQAAHDAGILHRDLKPSNVLLSVAGSDHSTLSTLHSEFVPKIADFGLAKRFGLARGADRTMTQAGDILGTPSYMSPEQAEGHGSAAIGPGADIYSLGAILYEMLAHRPPFEAEDPVRTVIQVLNDEPTPIAKIASGVPRDLETICLKCLQKDPRKRYASAGDLAEDLGRFLAGRPIVARPVSTVERAWKWARRRPAIAGMLFTTALAIVVAFVGITAMWVRANERATLELEARKLADARGDEIKHQAHEMEHRLVRGYVDRGLAACQTDEVPRGMVFLAKALEMIEDLHAKMDDGPDLDRLKHLEWVVRTNLAVWQSRMTFRTRATFVTPNPDNSNWVLDVDLSSDGMRLVTGSRDGYLRVFDAETNLEIGKPLKLGGPVGCTLFLPDGKHLLTARYDEASKQSLAQIWDPQTKEPIGDAIPLGQYVVDPRFMTFSNLGFVSAQSIFVQADEKTIRFYKPGTKEESSPAIHADLPITNFLVIPNSTFALSGHRDGTLRKWDLKTGKEVGRTDESDSLVFVMAASPDGKKVLAGHWRGSVRIFDPETMKRTSPVILTRGVTEADKDWHGFLRAAEFSPDGRSVVTGGGLLTEKGDLKGHLQTWDAESGAAIYSYDQPLPAWGVSFKGDSSQVVSVSEDCTVRVFSAFDGAPLHVYTQLGNPAKVVIGRDGKSLVAADLGSRASPVLADLGPSALALPTLRLPGPIRGLRFMPDGNIRTVAHDRMARLHDPRTGKLLDPELPIPGKWDNFRFSPEGTKLYAWDHVASWGADHDQGLWDLGTGKSIFCKNARPPSDLHFLDKDQGMLFLPRLNDNLKCLGLDGEVKWELPIPGRTHPEQYVIGSPSGDGKIFLTSHVGSTTVRVVDSETGRVIGDPWELPCPIKGLALNPVTGDVLIAFREGFLQAFDLSTRKSIWSAIPWSGDEIRLAFSPDGKTLCVVTERNRHQTMHRFDPITGVTLAPTEHLRHGDRVYTLSFSPNGRVLAAGEESGRVRFRHLPTPMEGSAAKIRCFVEMSARIELIQEPTEATRTLDDRAVGERRKQLRMVWGGEPAVLPVSTK